MKEPLTFVCDWENVPRKTWSGTSFSVYRSLRKHFKICNLPVRKGIIRKTYRFLSGRFGAFKYDFDLGNINYNTKSILQQLGNERSIVFGFCEFPYPSNIHSYIYQDVNLDFLYDLYKNKPELWKYNNYKRVSEKAMLSRIANQKEYYSKCSGVFTMSQWLKDYMVEKMGVPADKIHNVGAGIDIDPSGITGKDRTGRKILFVGRDFKRKGGELVLKAFKILKEKYNPFAELYIAGPKSSNVLGKQNGTKISGVTFIGEANKDELHSLYDACDIFCMPSYLECFGKVFIEALCCGLPCIGRNAFAMKDIIEDGKNGYLIDNDDADLLARKMDSLLSNGAIKEYVKNHQNEYLQEYTWGAVAKRMADVMNKDEFFTDITQR